MYPLFETIRYKNGIAENLGLHQQRVNDTLLQLNANEAIELSNHIDLVSSKPIKKDAVYKCRFQYDLAGNVSIQFEPYQIKKIQTVTIRDMGDHQYPFKYSNREWINDIVANAHTDEVILTHNGIIKDASYANLVFFDESKWITPLNPLFHGTRRKALLNAGFIHASPIQIKDLGNFTKFRLINAMMDWEESPILPMDCIKYST